MQPSIKKYIANQPWGQLTFADSSTGGGSTKPFWYVPKLINDYEIKPSDSAPIFQQTVSSVADYSMVNFTYDLGPMTIFTNAKSNDRLDVNITWRFSMTSELHDYELQILSVDVDLYDLLSQSTVYKTAVEKWGDSVYMTYFINGLRSSVRALRPPRIHIGVQVKSTLSETAQGAAFLAVFFIMRKINSQVYYEPVTGLRDKGTPLKLETLRLAELFQEP